MTKDINDLNGRRVEKETEAAYPPILDMDPIFAARFLCKEDLDVYFIVMKKAIYELCEQKEVCEFPIIVETMKYSKKNLEWFLTFYREMEILKEVAYEKFEIPEISFIGEDLLFQPPIIVKNKKIRYIDIRIKNNNPINKHRVTYIKRCLEVTDFREGYPAWYSFNDTTVFEKYDENSNTRVRIDFNNGEFLYYICGASDNWQQLQDVPLEIDYVISALLFRN